MKAVVEAGGSEVGKIVKTTVRPLAVCRVFVVTQSYVRAIGLPRQHGRLCRRQRYLLAFLRRTQACQVGRTGCTSSSERSVRDRVHC